MAVKKQEAAQAAQTEEAKTAAAPEEGTEEQDTVVIRLFKDSQLYSDYVQEFAAWMRQRYPPAGSAQWRY